MLIGVGCVVSVLFLRHWVGAIETRSTDEIGSAFAALWGAFFMAISFVTTTGYESAAWDGATEWSGLKTPGVALLGLAIVGGGAASTAGGVKLIRAGLLAKHSMGELRRLARPSSVQPISSGGRSVTFDAMRIVWVFVMLYTIALAICALGLTATGIKFVDAFAGSVAAISNTGPLLSLISGEEGGFTTYSSAARYMLCAAMIVGRMETLAVVALFSVSAWRR
jgi:trk system potassium uptake protein TrkH